MLMPKTAMNEDHSFPTREYHVRLAGYVFMVKPEPVTFRMGQPADNNLRPHALAMDGTHVCTAPIR